MYLRSMGCDKYNSLVEIFVRNPSIAWSQKRDYNLSFLFLSIHAGDGTCGAKAIRHRQGVVAAERTDRHGQRIYCNNLC
jgi:hypothetical protein